MTVTPLARTFTKSNSSLSNLSRTFTKSNSNLGSNAMSNPSKAATEVVQDTAQYSFTQYRVVNKDWEVIQKKTFTNWINSQLKNKSIAPVEDLSTGLASGEKLIQLLGSILITLEIIGAESLGRYTKNPKLRLQKIENCNTALGFIKKRGVNLTNIGAEDIVDSNPKLLLGLIWTIILRFTIADISEEGLTAKEGLLLWCQRRTTPYAADFKIKEFTFSWMDGLALCGLIHRHRPDLIDYHSLDKKDKEGNTKLAFDIGEKHLGISKLMDVEDLVRVIKPDERSVMTYVAQYFHAFSAQDKFGVAGRRVENLATILNQLWDMQNDYEKRMSSLMGTVSDVIVQWNQVKTTGLSDARNQLKDFEKYKGTVKRVWISERHELDNLLGNIQTKLKTYNLRNYIPPAGLHPSDLNNAWNKLAIAEAMRKNGLSKFIRDAKDAIRQRYAEAANTFALDLTEISVGLSNVNGELEEQLKAAGVLQLKTLPLKDTIEMLHSLDSACVEANIDDNEFTIYSVEDLVFDLSLVTRSIAKKITFIENQVIARTKTNFTPQQLEEYSETFKVFDKDNSNSLMRSEFKAALAAQGTNFSEEEFDKKFLEVSQGDQHISFAQFIEYARSTEEDKATPGQLKEAFITLSGGKDTVTETEMLRGGITQGVIDALKNKLPKKGDGYDFNAFVDELFA